MPALDHRGDPPRTAIADNEAESGEITTEEMLAQAHADREDAVVVRGRRAGAATAARRGRTWVLVTLVLDSAALIALERDGRPMWTRLKGAHMAGTVPVTHAGVVGQVWRSDPRQARLARALQGIDVRPLDEGLGRAAGALLGKAGISDVTDAAVVLLSADGDDIITSDPDDLSRLAAVSGRHVELIRR